MRSSAVKITIAVTLIVLAILITLYHLLTKTLKSQKSSPLSQPTPASNFSLSSRFSPSLTPHQNFQQPIFSPVKPVEKEQFEKILQLQKKFPLETADFYAIYSYSLEKFIIQEKTDGGKEKFFSFLQENGYSDLIKENIFLFTQQKPTEYEKSQSEILYHQRETNLTQPINQTNSSSSFFNDKTSSPAGSLSILVDLLKIIFTTLPSTTQSTNYSLTPSPPSNPTIPISPPNFSRSLDEIFSEVSQKVGVPKRILEAIVTIELPSTFRLSSEEVASYSIPGNFWPACGPNVCSATGPTQMTIGIDNQNSPTCSSCCWQGECLNSCPNAWRIYGNAVNIFAGENHQPLPCNIRDNIFASAAKLKNDSGASDPINWSKEEVFEAGRKYYGNCTVTYPRLGNRTYCQFMWDYYQTRL